MSETNEDEYDTRKHLAALIEKSPVIVVTWRNQTGWPFRYVSKNIALLGYTPDDLISGRIRFVDMIHPEDDIRIEKEIAEYFASGVDNYKQVYRLRHAMGHWVWIEDNTWLIRNQEGEITDIEGVLIDCSREKRGELLDAAHVDLIKQADELDEKTLVQRMLHHCELLTDSNISGCFMIDAEVEESGVDIWSEDIEVSHAEQLISPHPFVDTFPDWATALHERKPVVCNLLDAYATEESPPYSLKRYIIVPVARKETTVALVAMAGKDAPYDDADAQRVQTLADFTWEIIFRKRLEATLALRTQQLEQMARTDSLTELPNRYVLEERLEQALARSRRHDARFALAFVDLDGFKPINDQYGHSNGDVVLTILAERFRSLIRSEDTAARFGGDEFVFVFLDITDNSDAMHLVDRMLYVISKPISFSHEGQRIEVSLSASIGVTFFPQAADVTAGELLRQADQAMYEAKGTPRSVIVFNPDDPSA